MLCPEVLNFKTKGSNITTQSGTSLDKNCDKIFDKNVVFDQLKLAVPGSLHPPDDLKEALLTDTEFYSADNFPLHVLLQPEFLETFILGGKVYLHTNVGRSSGCDNFLCILPSGEHIDPVFFLLAAVRGASFVAI